MRAVVKIFLPIFNLFLIFFLTGCADQRYHNRVGMMSTESARPVFQWPIDGRVVLGFGSREDGVPLKGLLMQGAEGQEVKAAQQGRVVYVDGSLRGYGQTVVLEHANGYSTVYARNSQVAVGVGEDVSKGQPIARIGQAGKGEAARLYFEVRRDSKPMDPELLLK